MRIYTFHVSLPGHGRVWRKLELPAEATLETLHFSIQHAYDFGADHLYRCFPPAPRRQPPLALAMGM